MVYFCMPMNFAVNFTFCKAEYVHIVYLFSYNRPSSYCINDAMFTTINCLSFQYLRDCMLCM